MKEKIKQIALDVGGSHYPDVGGDRLQQFADALVKECIDAVSNTDKKHAYTTYDLQLIESTLQKAINSIKERFQ